MVWLVFHFQRHQSLTHHSLNKISVLNVRPRWHLVYSCLPEQRVKAAQSSTFYLVSPSVKNAKTKTPLVVFKYYNKVSFIMIWVVYCQVYCHVMSESVAWKNDKLFDGDWYEYSKWKFKRERMREVNFNNSSYLLQSHL